MTKTAAKVFLAELGHRVGHSDYQQLCRVIKLIDGLRTAPVKPEKDKN